MRDAVILSIARTPNGEAHPGAFNATQGLVLAAHAMRAALGRVGLEGGEVQDFTLGCPLTQATSGIKVARHTIFAAGLPDCVPAATIDRQCASGQSAAPTVANQIRSRDYNVVLAGGMDGVSLVQNNDWNGTNYRIPTIQDGYYMSMLATADLAARKYHVSRAAQDEYALISQKRTAAAQEPGCFADEVIPVEAKQPLENREMGEESIASVSLKRDECNRPGQNSRRLGRAHSHCRRGSIVSAGSSSQLPAYVSLSASEARS